MRTQVDTTQRKKTKSNNQQKLGKDLVHKGIMVTK
jgi:hypothetical protein